MLDYTDPYLVRHMKVEYCVAVAVEGVGRASPSGTGVAGLGNGPASQSLPCLLELQYKNLEKNSNIFSPALVLTATFITLEFNTG